MATLGNLQSLTSKRKVCVRLAKTAAEKSLLNHSLTSIKLSTSIKGLHLTSGQKQSWRYPPRYYITSSRSHLGSLKILRGQAANSYRLPAALVQHTRYYSSEQGEDKSKWKIKQKSTLLVVAASALGVVLAALYTLLRKKEMSFKEFVSYVLQKRVDKDVDSTDEADDKGKEDDDDDMYIPGRATVIKNEEIKVKFDDVAGCEEAKLDLMDFVNAMKNPEQYTSLGAQIPKGVIITGPGGVGKTMLVKATAAEAGVTLIRSDGADLFDIDDGFSAKVVKDMFEKAKDNAPCILFIDDVEGIARSRDFCGKKLDQERTLYRLVQEIDELEADSGIMLLAATRSTEHVDHALFKRGRFDWEIKVPRLDIKARAALFNLLLKDIKTNLDKDMLSRKLAADTEGLSGRSISFICWNAALLAAREAQTEVKLTHFDEAVEQSLHGEKDKTVQLRPEEKKCLAFHEAGHAIVSWYLKHTAPLVKITIEPRGDAYGYVRHLPHGGYSISSDELLDRICVSLGGRIAEEMFCGKMYAGARSDLTTATLLAYDKVTRYGMNNRIGSLSISTGFDKYSEETTKMIDEEVTAIVKSAYDKTKQLLTERTKEVTMLVEALLDKGTLDKESMVELLGDRPFAAKAIIEEFMEGTGSFEPNTELPKGLLNWNRETESKKSANGTSESSEVREDAYNNRTLICNKRESSSPSVTKCFHKK